jgi:hypothetical protein
MEGREVPYMDKYKLWMAGIISNLYLEKFRCLASVAQNMYT